MCAVDIASGLAGGHRSDNRHNGINGVRYRARDSVRTPLNRIVLDNLLEFKERLKEPPSPRPLPPARYRQWVLVIPKRLRYFMNTRPELSGYLSKILARAIRRFIKTSPAG